VTSSLDFVQKPVNTFNTVVLGTQNILEFAKDKNVEGMLYLSSLEVYGTFNDRKEVSETDFGSLDPAQIRSSYSEGKRIAETLCVS
ncbi:NAD-dependent epimerase/dehydratase family protein, partial [Staphylococcus aureus]|uniref:NAD-dependent epimerase/dehydratase family protein n=1 Tax=Staphylococcus aureus TaxID=1280 RepID=UPI0038B3BD99